jgi:hypothetical protein
MKKRLAGAPTGYGQGESNKIRAVKGAKDLPSCLRRDDKQGDGNDVNIRGFPDFSFDANAGFEFFDPVTGANEDAIASFLGRGPRFGMLGLLSRFHDSESYEI